MDDLGPNKQRLMDVAATARPHECLIDLGVREGVSSFAMLEATRDIQCRVIGVDPEPCPFLIPDRYQYLRTDSVRAAPLLSPGPYFLVFFDTLHVREQVMAELFHYWPMIRVGGWAVFHDSEWPEGKFDHYIGRDWKQVSEGIIAFFNLGFATDVKMIHYKESWGMTFIQKLTDWNPEVSGMNEALADSRRLTDAFCGTGQEKDCCHSEYPCFDCPEK